MDACNIFFGLDLDEFGEEFSAGASYQFIVLSNLDKYELVAVAAKWHAFLFQSMSDTYRHILRNSDLPPVSHRDGVLSVCLPEKGTSDQYVMLSPINT
uniref:Uncharacterized protein n=1 Tax=Romanomermis culicivorax TaxID=13658 RepID=A0A915IIW1_ROMCU